MDFQKRIHMTTGELHSRGRKKRHFFFCTPYVSSYQGFLSAVSCLISVHLPTEKKKIKQRQSTVFHGTLVTPLQIAGFTDFYSWCQPWCEPAGTGWLAELASSSRGAETWNVEKKPGLPMHSWAVADFLHKLLSCFYSQGLPLFFSSLLFCIPAWLLSLYSCAWIPTGKCT